MRSSSLLFALTYCLCLPLQALASAAPATDSQQQSTAAAIEPAVNKPELAEPVPAEVVTDESTPLVKDTSAPLAAPAADNNTASDRTARLKAAENNSAATPSSMTLMKIVITLALVVVLVIGLGWLFKKLSLRLPGTKHIKVISSLPLGQRERILVIEMQGKQRVIGVTPHNINLLFELENPLPDEKLASDFHTQLQSFLKK